MYGMHKRAIKTDRRDARALAEACKNGIYHPTHRLSDARRQMRNRLAIRDAFVKSRTGMICVVRAQLRSQGFRVNTGSANTFVKRVKSLELDEETVAILSAMLTQIENLTETITTADKALTELSKEDADVKRLCSMPSIGPVTAAAFVSVIDDAKRFKGPHQVQAYLGLVPREMSSGEKQIRGRITKKGNPRARWLLVQAALSTMRLRYAGTARLWVWAEGIAKRRGKRIAVVALARRLAGIMFAMMRDESNYLPLGAEEALAKANI